MTLSLYADECVHGRIVAGLRRRGVNVTTAFDEGLSGAADAEHFERATELGRVLLTSDRDFLRIAQRQLDRGRDFFGVVFILPEARVGDAVRAIVLVAEVLTPPEMKNWMEWVP